MFILTANNNRYVFVGYNPTGETTWVDPHDVAYFRPLVFATRDQAEHIRRQFPEPASLEIEICSIITPF